MCIKFFGLLTMVKYIFIGDDRSAFIIKFWVRIIKKADMKKILKQIFHYLIITRKKNQCFKLSLELL